MKQVRLGVVAVVLALLSQAAHAQVPAGPGARPGGVPQALPEGWEEIDQRLVFFTVQLASVEASIDAVNKSLRVAGYRQTVRQGEVARAQRGNELMDRNAGGPVNWRDFYGQTAERFFYRPTIAITATKFDKQALKRTSPDDLSQLNAPGPASLRPPQFDYIYRANNEAQKRAAADAAALGGKIDALLDRRRQLEAEQASTWAKISFQAVASRRFGSKPLYRFDVKFAAVTKDELTAQRVDAARAAAAYVRTVVRACADAQDVVGNDGGATFDALQTVVAGATGELTDRLARGSALAAEVGDTGTTLGKVVASAERLADVTKNLADAYANAADRDRAGDEAQKQTFRAFLQQSLFDCAANVATTAELVSVLAREWNVQADVDRPTPTTGPSAFAAIKKPAAKPTSPSVATDSSDGPAAEEVPASPAAQDETPAVGATRKKGTVNLLPLINPQEDKVDGQWQVVNGVLRSGGQGQERIEIPYEPPDEYDFEIEFTKHDGKGFPVQILSRGGKPFIWVLGTSGGNTYTFHYLQNAGDFSNKTTVQYRKLEKNRRYRSIVKVRRDGAKAYLNGKLVGAWETDFSDQAVKPFWSLRNHSVLGVGAGDCVIDFHVVRVVEVSAAGEALRDAPPKPGPAAPAGESR